MKLIHSAEEKNFRQEVREWLHGNVPKARRPLSGPALREFDLEWQRRQHQGGWAGIAWPREYGGRGLSLNQQVIWYEECALANAPVGGSMFVALTHAGPTLIMRGSEAQKRRHLPAILEGQSVWCQGFSEPGAGSDLAGIRAHARVEGDHLVVNGSKIWTSYAYLADYQELLVRTDPSAQKHRGLSWVICDMRTPGISIHKIATLSGTGNLCQVFYDEVKIPLSDLVGDLHDGWSVAMTTLGFERGTAFINHQIALAATLEKLVALAADTPSHDGRRRALDDEAIAEKLIQLRVDVAALRAMTYLTVSRGQVQAVPGAEGNIIALHYAELSQRIYALMMELQGPQGLQRRPQQDGPVEYMDAFKNTIAGGTSEIRRNIIAERVLGLPRVRGGVQ